MTHPPAWVFRCEKDNGVSCFSVDQKRGLKLISPFQAFHQNLTTPPNTPFKTVSHVLFSPDGTKLRADVKGNLPVTGGFVATWNITSEGILSPTFIKTTVPIQDGGFQFGMI